MADCIAAIPLPCSLPQIWGTQSHILTMLRNCKHPFSFLPLLKDCYLSQALGFLAGKEWQVQKEGGKLQLSPATAAEEEPSTRAAQPQVAQAHPYQRSTQTEPFSTWSHLQGNLSDQTIREESFAQEPPLQECLGQDRKASKHFRHGIKEKTKLLLNLPALPCQKTRMETITFKSKGRSYSKEQQPSNKKPPPVHCCLCCRKHHLPRQLVKSRIKCLLQRY